jgi:hypothetical protein
VAPLALNSLDDKYDPFDMLAVDTIRLKSLLNHCKSLFLPARSSQTPEISIMLIIKGDRYSYTGSRTHL